MSLHSKKHSSKAIYFTDDILDLLSDKTGKDKALLADIIKHHLNYIKKSITEDEKIIIVNFPSFGKMLFNYNLGCSFMATNTNTRLRGVVKERLNYLYNLLKVKDGPKLKNFNKPMVNTLTYDLFKEVPRNVLKLFYKHWKVLEDKHNKDHEKYL